jgi:two-component system sensor histidine kinase BaeS
LANTVADMNRLVGDLHQLASADAGARDYQFHPVEVADLLLDLERAFTARLEQQRLSLQVVDKTPVGFRIEADRMRLTQVLSNLLTNSSRYTDAGGQVRITATFKPKELTLVVEDSAPGVPPQALPQLFNRFYRVDASRSRENGGSGLGLSICQAIVEAHHGVIVASASLLGGLRVEINLPLVRVEQVAT